MSELVFFDQWQEVLKRYPNLGVVAKVLPWQSGETTAFVRFTSTSRKEAFVFWRSLGYHETPPLNYPSGDCHWLVNGDTSHIVNSQSSLGHIYPPANPGRFFGGDTAGRFRYIREPLRLRTRRFYAQVDLEVLQEPSGQDDFVSLLQDLKGGNGRHVVVSGRFGER